MKENKLVLLDFYADWCMPCKLMSPIIEELENDFKEIKVVKINAGEDEEKVKEYEISSLPTILIIKNNKEVDRVVGVISKEDLELKILGCLK